MATPTRIGPPAPTTPTEAPLPRDRTGMPPDLLREASKRLAIMSLVVGTLWILGTVTGHVADRMLMRPGDRRWLDLTIQDAISLGSVLVSAAMFLYARRTRRDPAFVLDLGLGYMVLMALALGIMFHWEIPSSYVLRPEIGWDAVLVLITAAIVPCRPWKMLVAALIAASMNPLGMLVAHTRGTWQGHSPLSTTILMHYPDYLVVGAAVVISLVLTRLGRQVTRAREMGSYQLGELLGSGGMGRVYRATHRMLARPAAIKLIRPEMLAAGQGDDAEVAVKRFTREAEAAANLRSPHTVEVYDFGVTEDGTLYYVMELLDGMDLETLVRDHGPLAAPRAVHVLCQVCDSLEEAHRAGMVHRDIKPANIHVGTVGIHHDFVKVLDFGLVKPFAGPAARVSLETAVGWTPGTPAYMAPEMALGETVDGRADIYALGCVAYWLLTGELIFEAETTFQMIARHLSAAPSPPSLRAKHPVPQALDAVVLACVAKTPAERPASAAEVARLLRAVDVEPWDESRAAAWWASGRLTTDVAAADAQPSTPGSYIVERETATALPK